VLRASVANYEFRIVVRQAGFAPAQPVAAVLQTARLAHAQLTPIGAPGWIRTSIYGV